MAASAWDSFGWDSSWHSSGDSATKAMSMQRNNWDSDTWWDHHDWSTDTSRTHAAGGGNNSDSWWDWSEEWSGGRTYPAGGCTAERVGGSGKGSREKGKSNTRTLEAERSTSPISKNMIAGTKGSGHEQSIGKGKGRGTEMKDGRGRGGCESFDARTIDDAVGGASTVATKKLSSESISKLRNLVSLSSEGNGNRSRRWGNTGAVGAGEGSNNSGGSVGHVGALGVGKGGGSLGAIGAGGSAVSGTVATTGDKLQSGIRTGVCEQGRTTPAGSRLPSGADGGSCGGKNKGKGKGKNPKKSPEERGFKLSEGGIYVRAAQLRQALPIRPRIEIGNLEKAPKAGRGHMDPLPLGGADLEVLCNRQSILGNPFNMIIRHKDRVGLHEPGGKQRGPPPVDESLREPVCEAFEQFFNAVMRPQTSGPLEALALDSATALALPRSAVGQDWLQDFGDRSAEEFRSAFAAVEALVEKRRTSGGVRLLCHCVPKRCHCISLANALG